MSLLSRPVAWTLVAFLLSVTSSPLLCVLACHTDDPVAAAAEHCHEEPAAPVTKIAASHECDGRSLQSPVSFPRTEPLQVLLPAPSTIVELARPAAAASHVSLAVRLLPDPPGLTRIPLRI